jgi:hypothetical protein
VIGAILLSPLAVLAIDWVLWSRIDGMMVCAWLPRSRWRLRRRRWLALAAMVAWCVLVAFRNRAPPVEDAAGHVLLGTGLAIMVWWIVAIYRDVRDQA